ncbi:MAG: alkaline phosphatase family protein, partial [Solirubrobacterales bacterium]
CRHPGLNSQDSTQTATATDQYAARHNPFVYFHSIIDFPTCQAHDVDLSQLSRDLASESTTPDYSFITPDLCNDGHDSPCADGGPGGLTQADGFLQTLIPQIEASPAYAKHGLIVITFDEAKGGTSPQDDGSACCGEQSGPNTPFAGALTLGQGGGKVGAVLLSPCINPGTVTTDAYNHYSLLRSVEDNFGLPHLGFAGQAGLRPFGPDVLSDPRC